MIGGSSTTRGSAFEGDPAPFEAVVVLVGRTGLDQKLRLDPDLELVRVSSPLDAIGELANPVGERARRTVVIVGAGADDAGRSGTPEEFVAAVRRIVSEAVILGCADANTPVAAAYHGRVDPTMETDALRAVVHGKDEAAAVNEPETPIFETTPSSPEEETHAPAFDPLVPGGDDDEPSGDASSDDDSDDRSGDASADVDIESGERGDADAEPVRVMDRGPMTGETLGSLQTPPEESEPAGFPGRGTSMVAGEGDGALVAAMLGGRGVLEPAMDMLRSRAGRADVRFVSATAPEAAKLRGAMPVEFDQKRFGYLTTADDPEDLRERNAGSETTPVRLAEHARWLAGWLALADQQRRLRAEAMTDRVSGAWNRRYFDRFLTAAIEQARSQRRMLTVLVFDLDNFKQFNDEMGHEAGDAILRETVRLLHSLTRPTDRICRIGGDEFAVIFYEPEGPRDQGSNHPENFEAVAERFQRAIKEQRFPRLGIDAPGRLTISGGLATFPWDGNTPEELLRKADKLAMESKRAGKNSITFGRVHDNGE